MRLSLRTFSAWLWGSALLAFAAFAQANVQLNGLAVHTELNSEQFIAAIYSERATTDARQLLLSDEHKVMELRIIEQRIFPRRFQRMWIEGIAINAGNRELEQYSEAMAKFGNMLNLKLQEGDVFRIERHPKTGVTVEVNGVKLGHVKETGFFDLLLRTWIGPVPLSSDFRAALLSGGDVNSDLRIRFAGITPSDQRIKTVVDAVAAVPSSTNKNTGTKAAKSAQVPAKDVASAATTPSEKVAALKPIEPLDLPVVVERAPASEEIAENEVFDESDARLVVSSDSILHEQLYISMLTRRTSSFASYPQSALKRGHEGTVRLTVTLGGDGEVKEVIIVEKARHDALNRAAEEAVKSASPYPPIPQELALQEFQFTVPLVFRLH